MVGKRNRRKMIKQCRLTSRNPLHWSTKSQTILPWSSKLTTKRTECENSSEHESKIRRVLASSVPSEPSSLMNSHEFVYRLNEALQHQRRLSQTDYSQIRKWKGFRRFLKCYKDRSAISNSVINKFMDIPNTWIGHVVIRGSIRYSTNESLSKSNQKEKVFGVVHPETTRILETHRISLVAEIDHFYDLRWTRGIRMEDSAKIVNRDSRVH